MQTELLEEDNFLCCTTERIFERKDHFYDVFFDIKPEENINIRDFKNTKNVERVGFLISNPDFEQIKITEGDKIRYNYLRQHFQAVDENLLLTFIQDINNKLFDGLIRLMRSVTKDFKLSPDHMSSLGMHKTDFLYITSLVERFNLKIGYKTSCQCCG